uniref:Uncharacterized protein n=1 Tax=Rhizophora mucronata TaxID=61149 RepID=A0A2P2Q6S5_RHIMU
MAHGLQFTPNYANSRVENDFCFFMLYH